MTNLFKKAFIVLMLISFNITTYAGPLNFFGKKNADYRAVMPGGVSLVISPDQSKFLVTQQIEATGEKLPLFEVSEIHSVSVFDQSTAENNNNWAEFHVTDISGKPQAASNWFMIGTDKGYQFLRRHTSVQKSANSPLYHVFTIAGSGKKPAAVSVDYFKSATEGYFFIISIKEDKQSPGQTVLIRESDGGAKVIADKFFQLRDENKDQKFSYDISQHQLKFHSGESFDVNKIMPSLTQTARVQQTAPTVQQTESSPTHTLVNNSPTNAPTQTQAPKPSSPQQTVATHVTKPAPAAPPVDPTKITYNDIHFNIVYKREGPEAGTYLKREKDGREIKLSHLTLDSPKNKFQVEEGILSYSNSGVPTRKIDMDAFDLESTWRMPPPQKEEPKALVETDPNAPPKAEPLKVDAVSQAVDTYTDYNAEPREHIKPIKIRETLVHQIIENLKLTKRSSTILAGESGDIADIVGEAIRRLPRTWRVLELDAAQFGSGLGISGVKEEKILMMEKMSQQQPTVFYAENFEGLRGLGAVSGDSRDALEILKKPIKNGKIRVIGTGGGEFRKKIADPDLLQAMQIQEVQAMSPEQVTEAIEQQILSVPRYKNVNLKDPATIDVIDYLKRTTRDFNATELEPNRSIKLLEKTKLPLTRKSIDDAAVLLYQLDPTIRERNAKLAKLAEYPKAIDASIIGHRQLKHELYKQERNFITMQHNRKGPAVRLFIDGPPGVAKTELAMEHAKSMGLEYKVILMATIKSSEQLMSIIRTQLEKNPFSVLIFDEIDKLKDKSILESLLTFMNQETSTFPEKVNGVDVERTVSASNSRLIVTSNLLGKTITEWYKGLSLEEKERDGEALTQHFLSEYPISVLVEKLVAAGIPYPFIDRFGMHIGLAFPPTIKEIVQVLKLTSRSSTKQAVENMRVGISMKNDDAYIDSLAHKYRDQNLSTRQTLDTLADHLQHVRGEIYLSPHYKEGATYQLDVLSGEVTHLKGFACEALF